MRISFDAATNPQKKKTEMRTGKALELVDCMCRFCSEITKSFQIIAFTFI